MPPLPLQSKDHGQLLDVIDLLRSQGISHYVRLPQLIVCGDQSSGKSSVLEAVSGVRFPTKDILCTRFATELILRRDPNTNVTVAIIPSTERSEEEKTKLLDFKSPTVQIDDLPVLIDAANAAMGLDSGAKAFSDDVLRIEISGPEQPHLTLVDLPGLIHSENKKQSATDVQLVSSLVRSYMANSRSIILAVVSAKNDYANQIVTKLARDVDPKGVRTLGIITKPDTLHVGSESEESFLNLSRNKDVVFRLGWHVLKNRDYDNRECSVEERDENEKQFFSHGVWASLPTKVLGIWFLRSRLSTVLKDQIISELPHLIRDIEAGIHTSQDTLNRLGEARGTIQAQRLYLVQVSRSFSSLVKAAVDGVYLHEFFGDAMSSTGFRKRLRAVVQDILMEFAKDMRLEGHNQEITEAFPIRKEASLPKMISRSAFLDEVCELMRKSRGCELPGTFNPLIVGDIFYQQSRPWKQLIERYSQRILYASRTTLEIILLHTADQITSERLTREIIDPALSVYAAQLEKKVAEIMRPHQKGHPITYNHYFTDTIQKARHEHTKKDQGRRLNSFFGIAPDKSLSYTDIYKQFSTGKLLDALNPPIEVDMDRYSCSEAIDCMEAYYKVAMKVIVDNFAALVVENCLLDRLSDTFSPDTVMKFDDDLVRDIAAETEDSQIERALVIKKLEVLEAGLQRLNRLGRINPAAGRFEEVEEIPDRSKIDKKASVDHEKASVVEEFQESASVAEVFQESDSVVEVLQEFDSD